MEYESIQYFIELVFMKKVCRIHFYECSLNMSVNNSFL
jgi:hypothetical protein